MDHAPTHQPPGYRCPLCRIVAGGEDPRLIVLHDENVRAVLALHQQTGNFGSLLLFPARHVENLYAMPDAIGSALFAATRRLAVALKDVLGCDGVTIRQNNEPAGDQAVWHYHVHVAPRYAGDDYHHEARVPASVDARIACAGRLRAGLLARSA